MNIIIAGLAAVGATVIFAVVAFFALMFVFERTFDSDEGLGIIALAGTGAIGAAHVTMVGTFVVLL